MKIPHEQTLHIARLAKIHISDGELAQVSKDLGNILAMMESLNKIDCDGIEPMAHPLENANSQYREDTIQDNKKREDLQQHAPHVEAGLYLVPKVIE